MVFPWRLDMVLRFDLSHGVKYLLWSDGVSGLERVKTNPCFYLLRVHGIRLEPMGLARLMAFVHGIHLSHMVLLLTVFVERVDLESLDHLYI